MGVRMTGAQVAQMIQLLTVRGHTYDQLVEATGIAKTRIAHWLKNNMSSVRVVAWAPDKNGRPFVPVWQWGEGVSLPRPGPAMTSAERMRVFRAKQKGEKE